jgi:beta-glucosidase
MNGVLRKQWGWDGFVVSDYDAWANILGTHHYTKTMAEAAAVGINAGPVTASLPF